MAHNDINTIPTSILPPLPGMDDCGDATKILLGVFYGNKINRITICEKTAAQCEWQTWVWSYAKLIQIVWAQSLYVSYYNFFLFQDMKSESVLDKSHLENDILFVKRHLKVMEVCMKKKKLNL